MLSRRRFLLGAGAGALVGLGACGLPDDDRPRAIDSPPRDLVPSTVPPQESGGARVDLYFIDTQTRRLRAVRRQVETVDAQSVLQALFGGLGDSPGTLISSIPLDTVLNSAEVVDGILVADLGPTNGGIGRVEATEQLRAFAQIVFTATALRDVNAVRFTLDGEPLAPTTAEGLGTVRDRPVDRTDYASLAPGSDEGS